MFYVLSDPYSSTIFCSIYRQLIIVILLTIETICTICKLFKQCALFSNANKDIIIISVTVKQCDRSNQVPYVQPYKYNGAKCACAYPNGTTITTVCLKIKLTMGMLMMDFRTCKFIKTWKKKLTMTIVILCFKSLSFPAGNMLIKWAARVQSYRFASYCFILSIIIFYCKRKKVI